MSNLTTLNKTIFEMGAHLNALAPKHWHFLPEISETRARVLVKRAGVAEYVTLIDWTRDKADVASQMKGYGIALTLGDRDAIARSTPK